MEKQYINFFNDWNFNINVYLTGCNIKTRNKAGPGIWMTLLLPIAIIISFWKHPECSQLYKTCVCASCGLLIHSILLICFINQTSKFRTICCAVNSAIITLLLLFVSEGGITSSLVFGILSSFGYNRFLLLVLQMCPESFTFGEAATVVQGIILFMISIFENVLSFFNVSKECMTISTIILQVGQFGVLGLCISIYKFPVLQIPRNFYITTSVVLLSIVLFLHYILKQSAVLWLVQLLSQDVVTVNLLLCWLLFSVLAILGIAIQIRGNNKASTIVRKYFHLLALGVYIPGLIFNQCLLYTASGVVLALFIVLETMRILKLPIIGTALDCGFQAFVDEKDNVIALTPIYLLVACSLPLWIHPNPSDKVLLPLMSGLLAIGVGDTAASICGTWFGEHNWPGSNRTKEGTLGCFISQLFTVLAFIHYGYVPRNNLLRPIVAIITTSLVEAITDQVDNLALPLLSYIILV
uniref:dolichol kinase n=1 Tax=Clastoptera arizonana TaxID=38151 RepID=A0A1B6D909_9HEMI